LINITPYGKDVVLKVFLISVSLAVLGVLIENGIVMILLLTVSVLLWLFTMYFFRDPLRNLPQNYKENQVISPADGKVVVIDEIKNEDDNNFPKGEALKQISIFLSPLNVHVNRIPISGTVDFLKYVKGEYLVAFDHKSSSRNERSEIGIIQKFSGKKILFKQIAGFVARRIVYEIAKGADVKAGEKFGMIKFGSRMDILIDKNSKILVSLNQKVTAGETIIAEL